jgi:hypothetical protein
MNHRYDPTAHERRAKWKGFSQSTWECIACALAVAFIWCLIMWGIATQPDWRDTPVLAQTKNAAPR